MIPLFKPYMPDVLPELDSILHSGNLSYGKWGKTFEDKLSDYIGTSQVLTTNTYSSAIQVALTVLGLNPGDEVIASPMSCLASNQPLVTFGLQIVWADIDPVAGTLDPQRVEAQITSKTKLIFHNHFAGFMGHVDEMNDVGKKYGIPVIDDCVEAFGSEYKNHKSGNLGTDITIFSFQTIRLPNTIEGGALVFKNKEQFDSALLIRDLGIQRDVFRDKNNEISSHCDIKLRGYSATMNELSSYIGWLQMDEIHNLLSRQRTNAKKWDMWFENHLKHTQRLNNRMDISPNYWVYGFLSENKLETLLSFRENDYYASGVHINNNIYSIFKNQVPLNGVEEFNSRFIAIPCGWWFEV
jgi:dTDP-4-amino-4,6-dideoxygalactose transaminase